MKKGDLVKLRPGTAEGDEKSVGKPWFRYKDEVELVSEKEWDKGKL